MDFLIDGLAIYRLSRLVTKDDFPPVAYPVEQIRSRFDESERFYWISDLTRCIWCLSFWMALSCLMVKRKVPTLWKLLSPALAFSAVAGLIDHLESVGQP